MGELSGIFEFELLHNRESSRQARTIIRAKMPVGPGRDSLEVITSELVTNAYLHGSGNISCRVFHMGSSYRIEVSHESTALDLDFTRDEHPDNSEGGRGLGIVKSLATNFGLVCEDNRLTVWAEVAKQPETM